MKSFVRITSPDKLVKEYNTSYQKKFELLNLSNIYLISALIISIIAFFILYTVFVIPIIYLIKKFIYNKLIKYWC